MKDLLVSKLRESLVSVLPVALLTLLLSFTPLFSLTLRERLVFSVSTLVMILGIGLFNLGADLAMTPMGENVGSGLIRTGKLWLLLGVCFLMGVLITVAEPDLSVLASQVSDVMNGTVLIVSVGIGVGLFLVFSLLKIVFQKSLSTLLMLFYMLMFALASLVVVRGNADFLALSFDSGGVTTGPVTVPFIMALGVGIASRIGGRNSGENSFGLISLCSAGPILVLLVSALNMHGELLYEVPAYSMEAGLGANLLPTVGKVAEEVGLALGLICGFFLIFQFVFLKLPAKKLAQIAVGIFYTFVGLVLFLSAVSIGFMPVGYRMGTALAGSHPAVLVAFAFVLGLVVVLAEPAVHVLNKQVEELTGGTIRKRSMMLALSIGVGTSIALSILRIVLDFSILYYLIPGYFLSLALSLFVPPLYTAVAFDSGGVASGPLTSSFILPFAIGACVVLQGESAVLRDGFGIVAMVAMTPLISIQLLGFQAIFRRKLRENLAMKQILSAEDEQIIEFM